MDCPCCHKSLPDKARRCPRCGTGMLHSCAVCGYEYPLGLKYCPNCNASSYAVQYFPNAKAKKKKSGPSTRFLAIVIGSLLLISVGSGLLFAKMNEKKAQNLTPPKPQVTATPAPVFEPVEEDFPVFYSEPSVSWYEISAPSELERGSGFGVRGTIFTDVGVLTDVTVSIINSFENVVEEYSYSPAERSCDLKEVFDSQIHFGRLPMGVYYYRILATAVNGGSTVTSLVNYSEFAVTGTEGSSTDPLANSTWYFAFLTWKGQPGHVNADAILNTSNATGQAVTIDGSMFLSGGAGSAVFRGYVQVNSGKYSGNIIDSKSGEPVECFEILSKYTDPSDGTEYRNVLHLVWEEFDMFFLRS